jgi:hypothetical protein
MGLDITAYRRLTLAVGNEAFDETGDLEWDKGWRQLYVNGDFPGRADDIKDGYAYRAEEAIHAVSVGYGGHMRFRDQLAELVGWWPIEGKYGPSAAAAVWANPKPGPFVELINFSDCEGTIGTSTSAKLAKDFAEYQSKADAHPDEWFRELYGKWRAAFQMAADGGAVAFH